MSRIRIASLFVVAALVAVASACGGDGEVPDDAVAVVDEREIAKSEFDALMDQARASYKAQKRPFPKAGTPEFNTLKSQAVQFLVQRAQFELAAEDMGIEVSDGDVDKRLTQIKKQYFRGSEQRYRKQLEQQGLTDEQVRRDIRAQLIQERIFKEVTGEIKVTDAEVQSYYRQNKDQYGQPASRDVRHILVPTKKQADELYGRIKAGEDFAALAKQYSKDPGSASQGGKLTISKGQTVAPFDRTAFTLSKGSLSRPVKTQYGWHLIEPLSGVRPAQTTPLKSVKESIRQQLLQQKRNERMTDWVKETREEYTKKTRYQVGYRPPRAATATAAG